MLEWDKKRQKELKKLRTQMGKMINQDDWITEMGLDSKISPEEQSNNNIIFLKKFSTSCWC